MTRSKSNLVPPAEAAKTKEPETGPGSATCFCRRMDRRTKAQEARDAMLADVGEQIDVGPKFADFDVTDSETLDEFYAALEGMVCQGRQYRIRVALVTA